LSNLVAAFFPTPYLILLPSLVRPDDWATFHSLCQIIKPKVTCCWLNDSTKT